jgi:predicted HAD superfamily Cof-like phosphohydrolase
MKVQLNTVNEFNKAFLIGEAPKAPTLIDWSQAGLRFKLMNEENEEYLEACRDRDLVEIADALGDQLYLLCGTILAHGMQDVIERVFNEIHRSNMSKLDENGQPILRDDGKIKKGNNYFKPVIAPLLVGRVDCVACEGSGWFCALACASCSGTGKGE